MDTVILIDDEWWAHIGMQKLFEWKKYGFEVINTFTNSVEAYEAITKLSPSVVFTDICMPELTGIELLKKVREADLDTEIIIISGYGEFIYAQEALQNGAFDYRLKPLSFSDAEEILKNLRQRLDEKKKTNKEGILFINSGNENFQKLFDYVNLHYCEEIYMKQLSAQFFINETYCSELFKKHTGKNFSDYVNQMRVNDACKKLLSTADTVEQIGQEVGFKDYYYFNKVFKKYTKLTPTQYRKESGGV